MKIFKNTSIIFLFCFFISINHYGQTISANSNGYFADALRYSQRSLSGSSRVQGMGGVGVATGADISSININPAGLGLIRKGEMSITGSIGSAASNSVYFGNNNSDMRLFAGIPNFGIIFSGAKDDLQEGDFRGGSFGISFSKINNFQSQVNLDGLNPNNSINDYFAQQGEVIGQTSLDRQSENFSSSTGFNNLTGAAYYSKLIDVAYRINTNQQGNIIDTTFLPHIWSTYSLFNLQQSEIIKIKNGMYQWDFSYGANYKDKIYFGIGLGLTRINYRRSNEFQETPTQAGRYDGLNLFSSYTARGGGVNLKGGIIFRPNDAVRIGINFTTPTYLSINENLSGDFTSTVNGEKLTVPLLNSNAFTMMSPMRVSPGIAFFLGKRGMISGEFEVVNYASARLFNSPGNNFYKGDNQTISNIYQTTANIKLGAEFRYEMLRFRAGYAFYGDPYSNGKVTPFATTTGMDRSTNAFTLGFGVRNSDMYFDAALIIYPNVISYYQVYDKVNENIINANGTIIPLVTPGPAPIAEIKNNLTTLNFTIGTYFGQ